MTGSGENGQSTLPLVIASPVGAISFTVSSFTHVNFHSYSVVVVDAINIKCCIVVSKTSQKPVSVEF